MSQLRVGIVGAGIVGLAHAWSAAERGHLVTVLERSPQARGASIRNFGMVWPIGQPAGDSLQIALLSRQRWLKIAAAARIWVNSCGSIHLAHRADEWTVLQEFHALAPQLGHECTLLSKVQVEERTPAANQNQLLGGLYSPAELCVNPPAAIRALPSWLSNVFGVQFEFNSTVVDVDTSRIRTADGQYRSFDRVIVCGGADFASLFPETLANSGLKQCKLQMLKTVSQEKGWRIGPHLASGLTLRHYQNFEVCPGLTALKERIATESPELDRWGIHVMASQNELGNVILGDSHEYDGAIEPFDKIVINDLILRELRKVIDLPNWTIEDHWHGIYAKHPAAPVFKAEPLPNVFIRTGTGGSGMTMSFGLAERDWEQWHD